MARSTSAYRPGHSHIPHQQSMTRSITSVACALVLLAITLLILLEAVGLGHSSKNNNAHSKTNSITAPSKYGASNTRIRNEDYRNRHRGSSGQFNNQLGEAESLSVSGSLVREAASAPIDAFELYVVPGGGGSGSLPAWTKARLDTALQHYQQATESERRSGRMHVTIITLIECFLVL
jgi:hypothetical protein